MNAGAAFAYIAGVAALLFYGIADKMHGVILPVTMLALLVLSVLMMGYTLLLAPLELFFEHKTREGTMLFAQTLGVFAAIVGVVVAIGLAIFR